MRASKALLLCILLGGGAAVLTAAQGPCVATGLALLTSCNPEQKYLSSRFPLSSTEPITQEEITAIVEGAPAGLPSTQCCDSVQGFVDAECQCDPTLRAVLPAGSVTPQGLDGVLLVTGQACNIPLNTTC